MTASGPSAPAWVNLDEPSAARIYDYLLGGGHNFPVDREAANKMLRVVPDLDVMASWNRAFLRRAVLLMVEEGITQFLDLGSGIPTVGNVHEIARRTDPNCRVVYVDRDEVAVAHTRMTIADDDNIAIVRSDICQPHAVLGSQEVARVLDLRQPVGLLMVAVLHFVPDEFDPGGIIATYRDAVAPGSLLAMTHVSPDNRPEPFAAVTEIMAGTRDEVHPRSYGQVAAMFAGMEPVAPGVVGVDRWRPELSINGDGAGRADIYAGVARKV